MRSVADLAGLKIRSPEGLAADVFKRAGAAPVSMSGSETYGALEKGVIDAADNSAYANNDTNGMHKIAKNAWNDFAAQSDLAKEVFDAHVAFMKEAGLL